MRPVPYDAGWPLQFEEERRRLVIALEPWMSGGIHHVGSTAVPGLTAKPVLDILVGVESLDLAGAAFPALEGLGYRYRDHRPEAHAFVKAATHHLHLTEVGSDLWRERLAFRDALRADATLRTEYARWKLDHVAPAGTAGPYTASKTPFVARVLAGAGLRLKPDAERLAAAPGPPND